MAKISIEEVEAKLLELKIEPAKVNQIVRELEKVAEELKEERKADAGPKQKWEYVMVLNDPEGKIKDDFTGWVVQCKDGQDTGLVIDKLRDAAVAQNEAAKRKKDRFTCIADIFDGVKSKFLKEKGLRIKTKIPVRIIAVNGKTM